MFTFALGTPTGDLVFERIGLVYWLSAVLFAAAIAAGASRTSGWTWTPWGVSGSFTS